MSMPERVVHAQLVQFGESFVRSDSFKALFRDGMALIEETAAYLDGEGRDEATGLDRQASLAYAGESMRLTTRLMQIASWLLVQRAVSDGEITLLQARREKDRVRLGSTDRSLAGGDFERLPERLRDLVVSSYRLHARVVHLDRLVMGPAGEEPAPRHRPCAVAMQHSLLKVAFAS